MSGYLKAAQGEFSEAEKIGKEYLSTATSLGNGLFKGLGFMGLLGLSVSIRMILKEPGRPSIESIDAFSSEAPSESTSTEPGTNGPGL